LIVGDFDDGGIAWKLLIIDPKTVTLGVRIGEKTRLKKGIRNSLDIWDQVGWRIGQLIRSYFH
jgi:hypothetical protein